MKNFTLKIYFLFFCGLISFSTQAQEWNFSSTSFNALGSIATVKTVDGLTIYGAAGATIDVDANNKSLDGMDFTNRLKFGGTGTFGEDGKPVSRVISFPVTGNTKITIMGMSSSSSTDRELIIAAGKKETEIGKFAALGTPISKGEFNYTGAATTIYLFSPSSGVNLYYLKAAPLATSASVGKVSEFRVFPNPTTGSVFVETNEPSDIGIYSISGQLVKQQKVGVSTNSIDLSDMHSGLYFVKMLNGNGRTQKLIVR